MKYVLRFLSDKIFWIIFLLVILLKTNVSNFICFVMLAIYVFVSIVSSNYSNKSKLFFVFGIILSVCIYVMLSNKHYGLEITPIIATNYISMYVMFFILYYWNNKVFLTFECNSFENWISKYINNSDINKVQNKSYLNYIYLERILLIALFFSTNIFGLPKIIDDLYFVSYYDLIKILVISMLFSGVCMAVEIQINQKWCIISLYETYRFWIVTPTAISSLTIFYIGVSAAWNVLYSF